VALHSRRTRARAWLPVALVLLSITACEPLAVAAAPPAGASAQAPTRWRTAVPVAALNFLPIFVGDAFGYFLEQGIEQEIVQMSPPLTVPALLSDEIQVSGASSVVLRAGLQGAPVQVLLFDLERFSSFLVGRPGLQRVADLRGQTVAAGALGTASDVAARLALREAGLEPDRDVALVPLGESGAPLLAALEQGLVQAAVLPAGDHLRALEWGGVELKYLGDVLQAPYSGWGVTAAKLRDERPLLQRWVRAQLRALVVSRDEPDAAAAIAAVRFGLDPADALAATRTQVRAISPTRPGYASEEALQRLLALDLLPPLNLSASPLPIDSLVDFSLLEEARATLGLPPP
jgi:NitT/TauT family transport system substrate-binding protein